MFFRGDYRTIRIGSNLGKSAEADWKKDFFHKEDEMKDKVLFANSGIAKFMALLVTFLTMFASCNFVGGQDARNVVGGINGFSDKKGFFKSLEGTSPQPWENTFSTDATSSIIVGSQGWWGGAWGIFDNGSAMDFYFDLTDVAYATCNIETDADVKDFYITIAGEDSSKYSEATIQTGAHQIRILCNLEKKFVNPIITMGGLAEEGTIITPSRFAFYSEAGNEIVPAIVPKSEVPAGGLSGGNDGSNDSEDIEFMPTGMMTWADWGSDKVVVGSLEKMGFEGIKVWCNNPGSWAGLGVGMISYDGSKTENVIDLSQIKIVEFDAESISPTEFSFVLEDGGFNGGGQKVKTEIKVKTTEWSEKIHVSYEIKENHKKWAQFLYMLDGIVGFDSDNRLEITNLVFKDADGNRITNFVTRMNDGSDMSDTEVTDMGDF